jgi:hypothetical protein
MAVATYFECFSADLLGGVHTLPGDGIKLALTNTAPDAAADAVLADIAELSAGAGYSSGGTAVGSLALAQTGALSKLTGATVTFTASGGPIGPYRYVVAYNATVAGGPLIKFWDVGATTIADGASREERFPSGGEVLGVEPA